MPGKLWEQTREWHHACEEHAVGGAMATGKPPREWYASWLAALLVIHRKIDDGMPECARRADQIEEDLALMDVEYIYPQSATDWAEDDPITLEGFRYVLTGAHLMGGELMRRRLEGFPTAHLLWEDRKVSLAYLQSLRDREELVGGAIECFKLLLSCMDDIKNHYKF